MNEKQVRDICESHQLTCKEIKKVVGSFEKELFIVDEKYLIRSSNQSMMDEKRKIDRTKNLNYAPKILYSSDQVSKDSKPYYLILEYMKGIEVFSGLKEMQKKKVHTLGLEISNFLNELHKIKGHKYDIGHYAPIIGDYDKSWKEGHQKYWLSIYQGLKDLSLADRVDRLLELSHDYIQQNISCLDFEAGPSLIHNDLHYKNIIMNQNTLSGVIDWECSQYGEADFDLIHLLQWTLMPPSSGSPMKDLFEIIFNDYMKKSKISMIEKRLAIYLLEHDWIKILWSQGKDVDDLLARIDWQLKNLESHINLLLESN